MIENIDYLKRLEVVRNFTNDEKIINEVLLYNENKFVKNNYDFTDELFVEEWKCYLEELSEYSLVEIFHKYIIQFCFPVKENISGEFDYINAVRNGKKPVFLQNPHCFNSPENINLEIIKTPVGSIPVIFCKDRDDFENMLRIFVYKNEPIKIPNSQGACFVKGFNNWSRIEKLKNKWLEKGNLEENWQSYFSKNIIPFKELYQDKFIILSNSHYSGVSALNFDINEDEWLEKSYIIRREHEICHYYTLRKFNYIANNMLDEIIADFSGIIEAFGCYNKEKMFYFLGFENFPEIRNTGRFYNYFQNNKISSEAVEIIKELVYNSIIYIESFYINFHNNDDINCKFKDKYELIDILCNETLESLNKDI
ncbi:MAG: hypothetical protein M0Q02_05115 [Candidatus Muirbacterium halophilum]|nr:hypothetical protein [Candidatus Muirbacterium halophilum]